MAQKPEKSARRRIRRGTVYPNREPSAIGWVCCACFTVVLILCILDRAERTTCLIVGVCILLTIPLMMTRNIRIDYHEKKGFVYHNLLGMRKRYRWEEITYIRKTNARLGKWKHSDKLSDTVIELQNQKKIRVGWDAYNDDEFLHLAWKSYKERRNRNAADRSESIPEGREDQAGDR